MLEGKAKRPELIFSLLQFEDLPEDSSCFFCQEPARFRCVTCIGHPFTCQGCCLKSHQHNPFHKIQQWSGGFFQSVNLRNLGFRLRMGHQGATCPEEPGHHFTEDFKRFEEEDITFVNVSGVFKLQVSWCNCRDRLSQVNQLLQMGLYPATLKSTQSVFSFQLLDYFFIDNMECHTSASSFFSKLRRLTDNVDPKSVQVSVVPLAHCQLPYLFLSLGSL